MSQPTALQGRSGQFGMEGFVMGGSYIVLSSLMAGLVYLAPKIPNDTARNVGSFVMVMLAALVTTKIFQGYTFKTGMHQRHFFY